MTSSFFYQGMGVIMYINTSSHQQRWDEAHQEPTYVRVPLHFANFAFWNCEKTNLKMWEEALTFEFFHLSIFSKTQNADLILSNDVNKPLIFLKKTSNLSNLICQIKNV